MNSEELAKIKQYLNDNCKEEIGIGEQLLDFITENNLKTIFTDIGASLFSSMMGVGHVSMNNYSPFGSDNDRINKEKLNFWINQQMDENESFQKKLLEFMRKQGYENQPSRLYNKVYLDRRVFSRISSMANSQHPEKKTIFKLIIGLELELYDAEELLSSAGFGFNCHKRFDMILKYCIEHRIYDIKIVDEYLVAFDEKALFSIE